MLKGQEGGCDVMQNAQAVGGNEEPGGGFERPGQMEVRLVGRQGTEDATRGLDDGGQYMACSVVLILVAGDPRRNAGQVEGSLFLLGRKPGG